MPAFMSNTPGPDAMSPVTVNGQAASVPSGHTVSKCPSTRTGRGAVARQSRCGNPSETSRSAGHSRIQDVRAVAAPLSWSARMTGPRPARWRGQAGGPAWRRSAFAAGQDEQAARADPFRPVPVGTQVGLPALRAVIARDRADCHAPKVGAPRSADCLRLAAAKLGTPGISPGRTCKTVAMGFDLAGLLAARRGEAHELHARYLNPQLPRMLHAIGFDKEYERGQGAYLYDRDGNRYTDFLAGFGVFAAGRNHPVVRRALQDVLDGELADLVQLDNALLPGLLAERLLARAPGLDRVYFCNSGTEAVEAALKFARYATGRSRIIYCDHAYHGLTVGSLSVNGAAEFRRGFGPLLPDAMIGFGDLGALEAELRKGDVAAFIVEPVQIGR